MMPKATVLCGDAIDVLRNLPPESVNCCITSPPYYLLRDYGVESQIGLEASPEEYIHNLVCVFREVRRVLRNDGTLWVNIGDSYCGSGKGAANYPDNAALHKQGTNAGAVQRPLPKTAGAKPKDILGIPWKLAFALRDDGWYLRQDIIWYKPNCMPESVKDRCTKSHEYIFLLSKNKQYYFDADSIREPAVGFDNSAPAGSAGTLRPNSRRRKGNAKTFRGGGAYTGSRAYQNDRRVVRDSHGNAENSTGLRNKRDVWIVPTRGYSGVHYATFPIDLIEPCVIAGSPFGGTVIDPFVGSGTTGIVAIANGRNFVGIDINAEYCEMSRERIKKVETEGVKQ